MAILSISIPEPQPFDSLLSLRGRCAIVTGGSRGLGEAIVHRLSQAGASVVLTGRGLDALKKVESTITASGGKALGVQSDMASLQDSQQLVHSWELSRLLPKELQAPIVSGFPVSGGRETGFHRRRMG